MGLAFGCMRVDQSNVSITEKFGKFHKVLEPGCHCLPIGTRVAGHLSLKVQQLDVRAQAKTQDNVFVPVVVCVEYRVLAEGVADAFYKCRNIKQAIQVFVFDVVRATVAKLDLNALYEQKNVIAKAVEGVVGKGMSAYGVEIVHTHVLEIKVDADVKKVMNGKYAAGSEEKNEKKVEEEKTLPEKQAKAELGSKEKNERVEGEKTLPEKKAKAGGGRF